MITGKAAYPHIDKNAVVNVVDDGDVLEPNVRGLSVDAGSAVKVANSEISHRHIICNHGESDAVSIAITIDCKSIALHHHTRLGDNVFCLRNIIGESKISGDRDALVDKSLLSASGQEWQQAN